MKYEQKPRASAAKALRRDRALARFSMRKQRPDESDEPYGAYIDRKNLEFASLEA